MARGSPGSLAPKARRQAPLGKAVRLALQGAEEWETGNAGFEERLQRLLPLRVSILVTDNLHTMLSFGRDGEGLVVRVHRMFVVAPSVIVEALARYILGGDASASNTLDRYIEEHRWMIRKVPPEVRRQRLVIEPRGSHHDLELHVEALNRRYFQEAIACAITWGPAPKTKLPRRSIKLGSYSADAHLIRIHPALDQAHVPDWFVSWIVYHEMLHHLHGSVRFLGRRRIHTSKFREDERRYIHLEGARRWERANIDSLLWWSPAS